MSFHEIYFLGLAFIAELFGALSGVSSSTLFVPLAQLSETFQVTLALTAFIHVIGNTTRAVMYRREINWILVFKFGVPSIAFTALGAQFSSYFSQQFFSICLGVFLIAISIYLYRVGETKIFKGRWLPYFGGALSGLLTGLLGSGGALRSAALMNFNLTSTAFLATSTLIDFGGDIFRLIIYLKKGYLNPEHYFYVPLLMLAVLSANFLAGRWIKKISQEKFKKLVLIFIFLMGMVTLVAGLMYYL